MSSDADPARLVDGLGSRWTTSETSFKWHASCRHTHPAADALIALLRTHGLAIDRIESVIAHVHQAALDVLGPVTSPATVHQSKFSMGTVLAIAARFGHAGLDAFDREFLAPQTVAFRERVRMQFDPEVDAAYPRRWIGKVTVTTTDGRVLSARVDEPKGDPGNTLTRDEIERKAVSLAAYGGATGGDEAKRAVERLWRLARSPRVGPLLSAR